VTTIAKAFDHFLESVVELSDASLGQLNERVASIMTALRADKTLGPAVKGHHAQGSWAHRTIIRPVGHYDEFDADFLLQLDENPEWDNSPKEYLRAVRAAFLRHPTYKTMVEKKDRCVRIRYANSCHVDVVPYIVKADGSQWIVNWTEDKLEPTNPQGFTDWMQEKDELAQDNLRRVLRLMKYLRDLKNRYTCKSVVLTTIVGERVQAVDAETRYADVTTAFTSLMDDLDVWMSMYTSVPPLPDPSCPGTDFGHRWDQPRFETFRTETHRYAEWARQAAAEPDPEKAVVLWQKVFGQKFVLPPAEYQRKRATTASAVSKAFVSRAPDEEFPSDKGWVPAPDPRYKVKISASVEMKPGWRGGSLRAIRRLNKDRWITFRATIDVTGDYELWWKVRNHGDEAAAVGGLRGSLERDQGAHMKRERTLYKGRHHVEVYVVKNGRVVASDRHAVTID
jgi:hypothetical protein